MQWAFVRSYSLGKNAPAFAIRKCPPIARPAPESAVKCKYPENRFVSGAELYVGYLLLTANVVRGRREGVYVARGLP